MQFDTRQKKAIIAFFVVIACTIGAVNTAMNIQPNYFNYKITRQELNANLRNNKSQTIYFYADNNDEHLEKAYTVFPMAKKQDIEMIPIILDETSAELYNITKVPTFVHFENNKEIMRLKGDAKDKECERFFRLAKKEKIKAAKIREYKKSKDK